MKSHRFVVDTNVPLIANQAQGGVGPQCVTACTQGLAQLMAHGHLVIDAGWRILKEYQNKLSPSGQPGPGDAFLKWAVTHQANPDRCTRVALTPRIGDPSSFEEYPDSPLLAGFDPSDRKFVAVAAAAPGGAPILQGLDSKWWGFRQAFVAARIEVRFLCIDEMAEKFRKKTSARGE